MNKLSSINKYFYLTLSLCFGLTAQAQLLNETFENADGFSIFDQNGSITFFSDGSNDYFGIYDGDGDGDANFGTSSAPSGVPTYSSTSGNYIVGEDLDGEVPTDPLILTWNSITLSGETELKISADFASTRMDSDDGIMVSYRLDGGDWVGVLGITSVGSANSLPWEITDFTTGVGDTSAKRVTGTFTNLSNTITLTGTESTIELKAEFETGNKDDNLAMDNLIVEVPSADLTAPLLSSSSPADEATGVATMTNVVLTFDEDVQLGTSGNIIIKELIGDATFESFDVATSSQVTVSGDDVTIDPTSDLSTSTGYYLEIDSGAIEDISGNDFLGFSGNSTLNFTTSAPVATGIFINEVDPDTPGSDAAEFIELYDGGVGNTDLSGLVVVLYNGSGDSSYRAIDLDGQTTNSDGFFVIGNSGVTNVDIVIPGNGIQNGPEGVALHIGSASDYPNGTPASATNILDAVCHDDGTANDATLVSILTPGQSIVSESGTGGDEANSIARVPDGGTQLITSSYVAQTPTPGTANSASADTTAPTSVTFSPADDATDVLTIANLQILFDENIVAGTGNIEIYELGNATPVQTIDITTATVSDTAIQINPSDLTGGTDYYVLIDSGAITDTAGNDFAGIADTTTWSFTTLSGTLVTDEAILTGEIESAGGESSTSFYAQSTSGGSNNEYGVAEFDTSFEDFNGETVTDILSANLILTTDAPWFAASGGYVILFTTDSVADLTTATSYDKLAYDPLLTNGIDTTDFTYTPVQVGSGTFSDTTPGGFTEVVSIDLTSIESDLISAINNRDSFHFIIGSVDTDSGAVTFSGVGNTYNPGAPTLALTATTEAAASAINISESDGSTSVDETGPTSDTFDVVLNAAPSATITVTLTPDAQVTVDSATLTFTTSDWSTPQTVTVTAVDDTADEDVTHTGSVSLTASGDADYSAVSTSVSVSVGDNDFGANDAVINEFLADKSGVDTGAFIEIYGSPSTDYSSLYILEIEGDHSSPTGNIDAVFQVGTTDANGFWTITDADDSKVDAENGTVTYLLVQGFTGSANDDIDTDDDGTIDNAPWSSIIDGVATFEGGTDIAYVDDPAVVELDPDFDGGSNQVGAASRITDGVDNDLTTDWVRNDYYGYGLAGSTAAGVDGEGVNTPGASNQVFTDVTAPTVSTLTPADDATTVALADNLEATFSESIQKGTGTITLHLSADDSIVESFDVTSEAIIVFSSTLRINPTADLLEGVGYYVQIPAGALTDTAATPNAFAGITGTTGWNFIDLTLLSSEDFNDASGDADDWFNATVSGLDPWDLTGLTATVDGAGEVDGGAEKHYLVSPALNLSSETAITMSFDYEGSYDDSDSDSFELVYSTDYSGSGNPEATATWTEITFDFSQNLQAADPVALVSSGSISLPAALEGESTVYLAFRYSAGGLAENSEVWELDNILVQSTPVATDPLTDYLTARSLTSTDLTTDSNGNGFTVLEEYLAGFGDGSGPDAISYGIVKGATHALTLTSDLESAPSGITVVLQATSDLSVAFENVAFTASVVDNGDTTYTRSYTETSPPAGDQRFLRLSITTD